MPRSVRCATAVREAIEGEEERRRYEVEELGWWVGEESRRWDESRGAEDFVWVGVADDYAGND